MIESKYIIRRLRQVHIRFRKLNRISFEAVKEQLPPCVERLSNLTTLTLFNAILNVEVIQALGTLQHLNSLAYQVPYSYSSLWNNPRYGSFDVKLLKERPDLIPSKLRSVHVQYGCVDQDHIASRLLVEMLKASAGNLTTLGVDLSDCYIGQHFDLSNICDIDFPKLERLAIYHVAGPGLGLDRFYDRHSSHLMEVRVLLQIQDYESHGIDFDGSEAREGHCLKVFPRMSKVHTKFTRWPLTEYEAYLEIDSAGQLTATEVSLLEGNWGMLALIGERHPYIRVFNMWDGNCYGENTAMWVSMDTMAQSHTQLIDVTLGDY